VVKVVNGVREKKKGTVNNLFFGYLDGPAQQMAQPRLAKEALTRRHCGLLMAQAHVCDGARLDVCPL